MPTYACHNGNVFLVTLNAATKTEAENITGLTAIKTVYKKPWAGWHVDGGAYKSPQPFPSWIWNGQNWQAPIEKPLEDGLFYYWFEPEQNWKIVEQDQPYPSWIVDEYNGNWIGPKPKPERCEFIENPDGSITAVSIQENYIWDESIEDWKLVN